VFVFKNILKVKIGPILNPALIFLFFKIKTEHGETGESDHPDNDSKIAEEKTINEASAELR